MFTIFILSFKYICIWVKITNNNVTNIVLFEIHIFKIYLRLGQNPPNNNVTNIVLFEILRQVFL